MPKETRLMIEALRKERQKIAFDANMHKLGVVTPYTTRCAKAYAEMSAAIESLENPGLRQGVLPGLRE